MPLDQPDSLDLAKTESRRRSDFGVLPDEILVEILDHLDRTTPCLTATAVRRRPHEGMFTRLDPPIKSLSMVCQKWRRLTLPVLFSHLQMDVNRMLLRMPSIVDFKNGPPGKEGYEEYEKLFMDQVMIMTNMLGHLGLSTCAKSILVLLRTDQDFPCTRIYLDQAMPTFWRHLLQSLNLRRIVILGPPATLALLTSCVEDSSALYREEHYRRMQILELDVKADRLHITNDRETSDYGIATKSATMFRFKTTSLLHMRSWSHIGLNEGFSNYQIRYYPHGDEAISLVPFLFPSCCQQQETSHSHRWAHLRDSMTFLDSFSYTGDFGPRSRTLRPRLDPGVYPLKYLRKLNLKLLPDREDLVAEIGEGELENFLELHMTDIHHEAYIEMRCLMTVHCNENDWRFRTVTSDDHWAFAQYREHASRFEGAMTIRSSGLDLSIVNMFPEPNVWARQWEIVPVEEAGRVVHKLVLTDTLEE